MMFTETMSWCGGLDRRKRLSALIHLPIQERPLSKVQPV